MALKLLVSVVNTVVGALLEALVLFLGFLGGGGGVGFVDVMGGWVVVTGEKCWWSEKEGRVLDQMTESRLLRSWCCGDGVKKVVVGFGFGLLI